MSTHESMTPLSPERLAEIRARAEKHLPRIWQAESPEVIAACPGWCDVASASVSCTKYCMGGTELGTKEEA